MKEILLNVKGENKGHYVPGMISNGMLFISGQLSLDLNTRKVPIGGIAEHMEQALKNIDLVLQAAGTDKNHIVQCRIFLTNIGDWDAANVVYANYFCEHKPARIIIETPNMHFGCKVEIEAVAEI